MKRSKKPRKFCGFNPFRETELPAFPLYSLRFSFLSFLILSGDQGGRKDVRISCPLRVIFAVEFGSLEWNRNIGEGI